MSPIKVREIKTIYYHRFGVKYSVRISQVAARRIIGERNRLPVMGDEVRIRKKKFPEAPDFYYTLFLENCSGDFFLTSANVLVSGWGAVFNVLIQRRPENET